MQYRYPSQMARLEPFTMMGSIAAATRSVGLVVTANTTYSEPYNVARMLASLDYLSAGRIAWNVVTGADGRAGGELRPRGALGHRPALRQGEEFITVVRRLWGSWEDGALRRDKATGEFVAGDKVHAIDHRGQSFSVSGPLNVPRPPQGWPPLVQAGTSGRSRRPGRSVCRHRVHRPADCRPSTGVQERRPGTGPRSPAATRTELPSCPVWCPSWARRKRRPNGFTTG